MNQALAVGGAPRRVVRLRVIGGHVDLRDDVPRTTEGCPTERSVAGHVMCGHVKCKWHLWLVEGRDRPGRWRDGRMKSELRPGVVLEWPTPPSCALDVARRGLPVPQIAAALGLRTTRLHDILAAALRKVEAAGGHLRIYANDPEIPEGPEDVLERSDGKR